jgi:hypothetical protein
VSALRALLGALRVQCVMCEVRSALQAIDPFVPVLSQPPLLWAANCMRRTAHSRSLLLLFACPQSREQLSHDCVCVCAAANVSNVLGKHRLFLRVPRFPSFLLAVDAHPSATAASTALQLYPPPHTHTPPSHALEVVDGCWADFWLLQTQEHTHSHSHSHSAADSNSSKDARTAASPSPSPSPNPSALSSVAAAASSVSLPPAFALPLVISRERLNAPAIASAASAASASTSASATSAPERRASTLHALRAVLRHCERIAPVMFCCRVAVLWC